MKRSARLFEDRLHQYLEMVGGLQTLTPGFRIAVLKKTKEVFRGEYGHTYAYYDLASLTKIICTASLTLRQIQEKKLKVVWPIQKIWPELKGESKIRHLLTHQAGLDWWQPFYKMLNPEDSIEYRWRQLAGLLQQQRTFPLNKAVYSDLDLLVLGIILQRTDQMRLLDQFEKFRQMGGLEDVFFHPGNEPRFDESLYAPTEECPFRGQVMVGEVHDENAWMLGGVAPHAGLFGSLDGVIRYLLLLRNSYVKGTKIFPQHLFTSFVRRKMPRRDGDFAYLFMLPSKGRASCGKHFSLESFGHTGFTGTSLWYDPRQDFGVVILSNRVHPTRKNDSFNRLRPLLHDWAVECFSG